MSNIVRRKGVMTISGVTREKTFVGTAIEKNRVKLQMPPQNPLMTLPNFQINPIVQREKIQIRIPIAIIGGRNKDKNPDRMGNIGASKIPST